jgi:coproporphyrinogen III oxidase-like Fe-S oxidoreductase
MLTHDLLARLARRQILRSMHFEPEPVRGRVPPTHPEPLQLYIHVPFCRVLCPFCSFHRVRFRELKARRYFAALGRELELYRDTGFRFDSVYVGGGTPTVMPEVLAEILQLCRETWSIADVSVETNPDDLREAVLAELEGAGVTRLSVGVQSFDDRLLKAMGRYEKYGSGAEIRARLKAALGRFRTLNADMIFNLPGQERASLERDLEILVDGIGIDQMSFYPLMAAASTARRMRREMGGLAGSREREFYELIRAHTAGAYQPSSAWCFARGADQVDEYIVHRPDYVGVGSGAMSYVDGVVYANTFSLHLYHRRLELGESPITRVRHLSLPEQMRYDFLMQLFGLTLDRGYLARRYGPRFYRELGKEIALMRALGALILEPERVRLTERGMYYWVVLMREFFTAVNNFRDQMRHSVRAEMRLTHGTQARMPLASPRPV